MTTRRPAGRSDRARSWVAAGLGVATWLLLGSSFGSALAGTPGTASPVPTPLLAAGDLPVVTLEGPFGLLEGTPMASDAPLADPAMLRALDAFGRGASVLATLRDGNGVLVDWSLELTAEPLGPDARRIALANGDGGRGDYVTAHLPATGLWLLRLDATVGSRGDPFGTVLARGSWVWRLVVPDRDAPPEGEPYPPMPDVVITSGSDQVVMDIGTTCWMGTCGDVGFATPDDQLPELRSGTPGAPLYVELADHTGYATWSITVRPAGEPDDPGVVVAADRFGASRPRIVAPGPLTGDWVVVARLGFDLERGSTIASARVLVP